MGLALLLAVPGCGASTSPTVFTPHEARFEQGASAVCERAVSAYRGDVAALGQAGGVLLGKLVADRSVAVGERAAALGATHAVLWSEDRRTEAVGPDPLEAAVHGIGEVMASSQPTARVECSGDGCRVYELPSMVGSAPGPRAVTRTERTYALVRVEPSRWGALADALRPIRAEPRGTARRAADGSWRVPEGCELAHRDRGGEWFARRAWIVCRDEGRRQEVDARTLAPMGPWVD